MLNDNDRSIQYVNAGHNPPLLIRNGKITKLQKGGMILGVMKTAVPYLSEKIQLQSGDTLIMFTDGVTEAMDKNRNEFSDERLEQLAVKLYTKSAPEIISSIQSEIQNFSSGTVQSDDITLMVIKVR